MRRTLSGLLLALRPARAEVEVVDVSTLQPIWDRTEFSCPVLFGPPLNEGGGHLDRAVYIYIAGDPQTACRIGYVRHIKVDGKWRFIPRMNRSDAPYDPADTPFDDLAAATKALLSWSFEFGGEVSV